MAYYRINGKDIDIYCGNAEAWRSGCGGNCENCHFCEVEELDSGKKYKFIQSKYCSNESAE